MKYFLNNTIFLRSFLFLMLISLFSIQSRSEDLKISFPVEKYTLANGLTVLLVEDHSVPMISYHTWYRVGSRDEQPGVTGAAHMLEHMMFKGAKKYSGKDFDRILHENGVVNNAFTTTDYTGFYENLPSDKLDLIMDIEVDRMQNLALRAEDLKSELQVVAEERRWRVDNNPHGLLREMMMSNLYQVHPYRWPTIGYMKDIEQYTVEKLRRFYEAYYVPNNAVLSIAGDFDSNDIKKKIEKYYGPLPSKPVPARVYSLEPKNKKFVKQKIKWQVSQTSFALAFPGMAAGHEDSYALDLLSVILGGDRSSRLHQKLVYQSQQCSSVSAFNMTSADPGAFMISAELKKKSSVEKVKTEILKQLSILQKNKISVKELEKARNQTMMDYMNGLLTIDGKAQSLVINEIIFSDYQRLFSDLKRYDQVTVEQIRKVAQKYLRPESMVQVELQPKGQSDEKEQGQ